MSSSDQRTIAPPTPRRRPPGAVLDYDIGSPQTFEQVMTAFANPTAALAAQAAQEAQASAPVPAPSAP